MVDDLKPIIIIPAYKRPKSLARLLNSIQSAVYPEGVKIFISLEGGTSESVSKIAYGFAPNNLSCSVIKRETKLGLKDHIIACGDMALEYGAVIVLEDDLLVDRYFYYYATAALKHYHSDSSVAGIALYGHEYSEYVNLPFKAMANGYSTYPMAVPCSWGQCWTAAQWKGFKSWYLSSNEDTVIETVGLPSTVKMWPSSSWKKYFAAYMVRRKLYFIYPYQAYSTNCSDCGGEHMINGSDIH